MVIKLGNTEINKIYLGNTEISNVYLGNWLLLHTTNEDEIKIVGLTSKNSESFIIDWGDGTIETVSSSTSLNKTHTYGSLFTGYVKIKCVSSNIFTNLDRLHSDKGHWDFNLSVFEPFDDIDYLYFRGNTMPITGNLSSINSVSGSLLYLNGTAMTVTGDLSSVHTSLYQVYLIGSLMTLTGNLSHFESFSNIGFLYLIGSSMTVSGDLNSLKDVSFEININSSSLNLTYTPTTWSSIPNTNLVVRASSGQLTSTEVDNLLIDLDNSGDTGTANIDLRGNSGAPTVASASAITSLQSKGYNVLTN